VRILITGGAGFIGSHLADLLLAQGDRVRVLDSLIPQVHPGSERPDYLAADVELVRGDVRDPEAVARALNRVDTVYHLAARVGVGQSMYEIAEYADVNTRGTAVLLEALARNPVARLVVASSMSIYGEGRYRTPSGETVDPPNRSRDALSRAEWELQTESGEHLEPISTPEEKLPELASVYALSKYDQERLCLIFGNAYAVPTVALRFFNVYGPRQALSNPYTGVLAIFAARLLNNNSPLVFEDGLQRRDFVSVHDVARACVLALDAPGAVGRALNIGSGRSYTIREVASSLARVLGKTNARPELTGKYRVGDIRHCFADISAAREYLNYSPRVGLEEGLAELGEWLRTQQAEDRCVAAAGELAARGLTI
jgi:dTDP-L-rhamnose 4-epimerase